MIFLWLYLLFQSSSKYNTASNKFGAKRSFFSLFIYLKNLMTLKPLSFLRLYNHFLTASFHWPKIIDTISSTPLPFLTSANTIGPSCRIFRASRSITPRSAPTISAKSVLFMTNKSDSVIPGPPN